MAEGLAAVGVIASITQLADLSAKVIHRLKEFHTAMGEIPNFLRHINTELPVLTTALQNISRNIEIGSVGTGTTEALRPVVDGCHEQIAQLDAILTKTLPVTNDSRWTKSKKAIVSLHQEEKVESCTKILRDYIATLTFYHTATSSTLQPLRDEKLVKIRRWLSTPDPSTNYQKALKQRQDNTGLWFLESVQYTQWKMDAASFLWLHGIPGCGKTILSSTIIQNVFENRNSDPGKVVAYFFFDFNDVQKQNPELMVRSLICQLSQQCVKIPTSLDTLFSSCENGERQPSLHELLEVLKQMIREFPHVYIILDALDECYEWKELTGILETMSAWKLQNLHALLTSRRGRDIESSLETFLHQQNIVSLRSKLVDKDIQKYVQQRLSDDKRLSKWGRDPALRQDIEAALMKGAQGMFRWAVCQLDKLGECRTRAKLRSSLATLPPTLDKTYERILSEISEADSQYALQILCWLTFSARPLLVDEVAEIVAINLEDEPTFDRDEVLEDPLDVLNICSSLVTITTNKQVGRPGQERQIMALAHYSVKEYLVSDRIGKGSAAHYSMQRAVCHDTIARSCLRYLLQFQGVQMLNQDNVKEFTLVHYSAEFWMKHARDTEEETERYSQEAIVLLWERKDAYLNWLRIHDPDKPWEGSDFQKGLESLPSPLYYASFSGLRSMVRLLLEKGAGVDARGGAYVNALQAASCSGHEAIVKLLIEQGADVNAQGGYYGNALYKASDRGNKAIVKLLLDHGAEINAQDGGYGNALQAASYRGHEAIVKLLLEQGADVNTQSGGYGNALQAASAQGHKAVVELLLDHGAEINAQGRYYGNALQAASAQGHETVVELLLDHGADINTQSGDYSNALQAASAQGHETITKLLLEHGAEINAQGGYYGNALQAASAKGHEAVVKLLLNHGAKINAQGGYHGSALQAASAQNYKAVVKLLLDHGAKINAQGGYYGNALQAASAKGYKIVIKLLLDCNAEVNAQGGYYGNALQAASYIGNKTTVKLLLEHGAEVNAQDGEYGNALQAASVRGHKAVIKLLLAHGADVNAEGGEYGNALQAASARGHEAVIKLLLDHGADVNAQGGEYDNALQAASVRGHEAVKKLLLDRGADVNAQGGEYGNALQTA